MTYYEAFRHQPVILPVIHCRDSKQVRDNVLIAKRCRADGVFLVNQGSEPRDVLEFTGIPKSMGMWTGVNILGWSVTKVILTADSMYCDIDGVWADISMVDDRKNWVAPLEAVLVKEMTRNRAILYFGGVAFKYQPSVTDYMRAAENAVPYMDVVTTSGAGTGIRPDVEKIKRMNDAIPDDPIAIASGMTPENLKYYLDYACCFLVATGISKDFFNFDEDKLRRFVEVAGG